jgi:hypothetical protein
MLLVAHVERKSEIVSILNCGLMQVPGQILRPKCGMDFVMSHWLVRLVAYLSGTGKEGCKTSAETCLNFTTFPPVTPENVSTCKKGLCSVKAVYTPWS